MRITAVEVYRHDLPLETPFEHFASGSVRALRIYEGTTEIQHLIIAGQLVK